MKQAHDRTTERSEFFRAMQERSEKYQKYFDALARLPKEPTKKRPYSQYGNSTSPKGEDRNA